MDPKLFDGALPLIFEFFAKVAILIWFASFAWFRLKAHEIRLDKLEARAETQDEKLIKLMLEVLNRLERLETRQSIQDGESSHRRFPDRH